MPSPNYLDLLTSARVYVADNEREKKSSWYTSLIGALQSLNNTIKPKTYSPPMPVRIIFNEPATVVIWDDGTKTVVKTMDGDEFDTTLGVAMCYTKKLFGGNSAFKRMVRKVAGLDKPVRQKKSKDKSDEKVIEEKITLSEIETEKLDKSIVNVLLNANMMTTEDEVEND